jgi:peptide chain release factor 2
MTDGLNESGELLDLAEAETDEGTAHAVEQDLARIDGESRARVQAHVPGEMDSHNAIPRHPGRRRRHRGPGLAQMLMRMYLRWGDKNGFRTEVIDSSEGEVAGSRAPRSASKESTRMDGCARRRASTGSCAKVLLIRTRGAHVVRVGVPVARDRRRHQHRDQPADLEMDVYRSSGAGGQHVNKTESAVRIRHLPSGIVVACQSERSQHKNRSTAMKMLKAKLYELEVNKRNAAAKVLEDSKSDVSWGNQIRSYVLDQSRIKDLRTASRSATPRPCSTAI